MTEDSARQINMHFFQLVASLQAAAWQQMGKIASPITGEVERNLEQAKVSIDMLDMLSEKTKGPACVVSTACSSGNDALIFAARCIRERAADVMIAGGAEAAVTPVSLATFGNLKALSRAQGEPTSICRPIRT